MLNFLLEKEGRMRILLAGFGTIFMLMAACILFIAVGDGTFDKEFHKQIQHEAQEKLSLATGVFQNQGIEAATSYCHTPLQKKYGERAYWVSCGIAADFFDLKDVVVVKGNATILPVGIYTRSENGLDLMRRGYRVRDVTVFAHVLPSDRASIRGAEPIASAEIKIP
jgi:hypothetical protein